MTRTSATGKAGAAGFTLIEVLIVVFTLALLTGAVLMTAPNSRPSLRKEAEHFAARLMNAKEEAVLTGRTIEVQIGPDGFTFNVRHGARRVPLTQKPFARRQWDETTLVLADDGSDGARIAFDPTGLSTAIQIDLYRNKSHERISVDASGAVRIDATR